MKKMILSPIDPMHITPEVRKTPNLPIVLYIFINNLCILMEIMIVMLWLCAIRDYDSNMIIEITRRNLVRPKSEIGAKISLS